MTSFEKKVLVPLAEGFEPIEALMPVDMLRRAGIGAVLASLDETEIVRGIKNIGVAADGPLGSYAMEDFDALYLPGGSRGAVLLRRNATVLKLVRAAFDQGKTIAAICAAPAVLESLGLLKNRNFTAYWTIVKGAREECQFLEDGQILTGRDPGAAAALSLALLGRLAGPEAAATVAKSMGFPFPRAETAVES
ncbi:MAG: DJ-1/PfpI family protein [Puniceicoccales bacterium]|jgi:4-methyl-5(b-hydroxyethyl)-thiazole monophosphate biosynthesis|nr:DJ-1/PfpI family protein [Puniceicoccales bacterium]